MAKPKTFDEYLAALSKDKRDALQKLRKTIRAAAPKAEEYISYGLAAFRQDGKPLVALGAIVWKRVLPDERVDGRRP